MNQVRKIRNSESLSITKAAEALNVSESRLVMFCDQDTGQRYHHRTSFSGHIRFSNDDLQRISTLLTRPTPASNIKVL